MSQKTNGSITIASNGKDLKLRPRGIHALNKFMSAMNKAGIEVSTNGIILVPPRGERDVRFKRMSYRAEKMIKDLFDEESYFWISWDIIKEKASKYGMTPTGAELAISVMERRGYVEVVRSELVKHFIIMRFKHKFQ